MTGEFQPLFIAESRPELVFGVATVEQDELVLSSTMPVRSFHAGPDGTVAAGSLGVLIDNVIGYAAMLHRPVDHWSVTTEMSVDLCRPLPSFGAVRAVGVAEHTSGHGSISSGRILDDSGRLLGLCRQHARFIEQLPPATLSGEVGDAPLPSGQPGATVLDLLHATLRPDAGVSTLDWVSGIDTSNPLGNVHGGITLCAAEIAGSSAIRSVSPGLVTASIHVCYLRAIPAGTALRFTGTCTHPGRSFAVAHVKATGPDERLYATATITAGVRGADEIVEDE